MGCNHGKIDRGHNHFPGKWLSNASIGRYYFKRNHRYVSTLRTEIKVPVENDKLKPDAQIPCGRIREAFDYRVLAKYDIQALIGKGSFSRVVRAVDKQTQQPFAIKLIDLNYVKLECRNINQQQQFETELKILMQIKHSNIINLIEVFRTQNRIYMVLELATGGELYDRVIVSGAFSERSAARSIRQILDGVSYLHHNGITHRDIKLENLLYSHPGRDARLLITDFGLAHIQSEPDKNIMLTTCGTPEYIAPEILLRQPYSNKVDLWGVGVVTYILLSGIMPFDDDNRQRLYVSVIRGKYKFHHEHWSQTSREARNFVRCLLDVDAERRLTADEALQHIWLLINPQKAMDFGENTLDRKFNMLNSCDKIDSLPNRNHRVNHSRRSTRSMLSLARSEREQRVDASEVAQLQTMPEVQHILTKRNHFPHATKLLGIV